MEKKQHEMLLELSKKDINELKRVREMLVSYKSYEKELVENLSVRMKANGLKELGNLKIVKEFGLESVEIGEVLDNILNETLGKTLVVRIDLEKTTENLREKMGYSEVQIRPLIDLLKLKLGNYVERLEVK